MLQKRKKVEAWLGNFFSGTLLTGRLHKTHLVLLQSKGERVGALGKDLLLEGALSNH